MAKSVVRGKALVAKLRLQPGVRDAEALAATLGRAKKYRKAGMSPKKALQKAAHKKSGNASSVKPDAPSRPKRSILADLDDENFADDKSAEDIQREKHEAKLLRDMERAERSRLHSIIHDSGGLKTRKELREEYRGIPNTFKRKDGMPGDEMAEWLAQYYPEFGIEDERDLIDYLAS